MRLIQYTITVVDRATAVLDRINNSVERMTQPLSRLGDAVRRFGDVSGINRLSRGISDLALKVRSLLGFVLNLGKSLFAMFGSGLIADLYQMTEEWARLGFSVLKTSKIIGISTQKLMELRGVGDLTGISAETMTKGFQSFADTLQDAKWGRNQAVFGMMKMLGIDLKHTRNGVIDTEAVLLKLADKIKVIQKRDPATARKLAQSFGVEELLPVLMQGSKAIRSYQQETRMLQGNITPGMIERANSFTLSINKMKLATQGTKAAIADKLIPVFQPLIDKWTQWLVVNRQEISDKIAKLAERLAEWLDKIDFEKVLDGIVKFIEGCAKAVEWIDKTVDKLGGWGNVLKGLGVLLAVSFVAQMGVAGLAVAGLAIEFGIVYAGAKRLRDELMKFESFQIVNDVVGSVSTRLFGSKEDKETISAMDAAQDAERYKNRAENPAWYSNDGVFRFARILGLEGYMKENKVSSSLTNPKSPVLKSSYGAFKKSIIAQESGHKYWEVNPRTGAMGLAQIMPQNIVGWGKNAGRKNHGWDYDALGYDITPKQFLSSPELQHKIIDFVLKRALDKYGAAGAARWWYSNNPNPSNRRPTPNEPSPNEYATSVLNRMMQEEGNKNSVAQPQVNLNVQTTVHPGGGSTTKVRTPQGVKIKHNAPGVMN